MAKLKKISSEELKAGPGKYRMVTWINSEPYHVGEDVGHITEAWDLVKRLPANASFCIYDDEGLAEMEG